MSENRFALIIASYQYEDAKLSQLVAPAQDAEALARVLENPAISDFTVQTLINEPSHKVSRAIEGFFDNRSLDDLLLLYFSGHGVKDRAGRLYFTTPDTRSRRLRSTAIAALTVNDIMLDSRSKRQVFLLDCCFSGAFARGMRAKAREAIGSATGINEQLGGRGRVVLTSSDALQYSFEGDEVEGEGVRSVFTNALVQGLETGEADLDQDGYITLDELYDYAYDYVTAETPHQRPEKWNFGLQGKVIIARNPVPPEPKTSLPGWITEALASDVFSARLVTVAELAELSEGQDQSLAVAARAELERLSQVDENPIVRSAAAGALGDLSVSVPTKASPTPLPPTEIKELPPEPEPTPDTLTITTPVHLELIRIPAGEFLMGSDPKKDSNAYDAEQPQHSFYLPDYYIAKTPVTNAQYAAFVQDAGREQPKHWRSKKQEPPRGKKEHPVVNVSWHDAIEFCRWLSKVTGKPYRLPTEAEWEKAARGTDGWIYPWGDEFDPGKCNTVESDIGDTTAVGQYSPEGDSPYGCADMVGNVWEWTSSLFRDYPYRPDDGCEDLDSADPRVLRGGSFYDVERDARCAYRPHDAPNLFATLLGFRVCAAPFSPRSGL